MGASEWGGCDKIGRNILVFFRLAILIFILTAAHAQSNRAHLQSLEATVAADPNHASAIRTLAQIYARELLDGGPFADHARAALESSKNVWVLGNTAYTLQSLYNERLQRGVSAPHGAALAERYFLRAKALDPTLDRRKILPQIDLQAIARAREAESQAQREFEKRIPESVARIRRLPVDAFPELPRAIAAVLRARHCLVPQDTLDGRANVIRGQFFRKGESGWAVLCSDGNSTALLAFRNDRDTNPDSVVTSEDARYLQGVEKSRIAYSRGITAAGRDFIMRHYRANGGPEPPPIDHHGIEDYFLEKASVIWYFHQGKWLALPGAD